MSPAYRLKLVKGPAHVVVSGQCSVLGCDVSGQEITVRLGKILPFEVQQGAKLSISLGAGGEVGVASSYTAGTRMWLAAGRTLIRLARIRKGLTVLALGDSDAGKSTFCLYLANLCIRAGLRPCIIDSDIGQADLGPPGVIAGAILASQVIDLRDAKTECKRLEFVGSISPPGYEREIIEGIRAVVKSMQEAAPDVFIVNTDGYVTRGGVQYKQAMAKEIDADALVCLGPAGQFLGQEYSGRARMLRVRTSPFARKSPQERVARRYEQFANYLRRDHAVTKEIGRIRLLYRNEIPSQEKLESLLRPLQDGRPSCMFVGLAKGAKLEGFGCACPSGLVLIGIQTGYFGEFDTLMLSDITLGRDESDGEGREQDQEP